MIKGIMSRKTLIFIGMIVFSTIGGFIPMLWGDSALSMSSIFLSAIGGFFGIWAGYKVSRMM